MVHISDIKKFLHCERTYFYSKDTNNEFRPYLRTDESINDLIKSYLKIDNCFDGVKNDSTQRFLENVDKYEWFCHPRFEDDELRINIPFMHKVHDEFVLYFVYYGTQLKELDLLTYRISVKVLKKLNIIVSNIYLIALNENYINDGTLNPNDLFICVDTYKDSSIIDLVNETGFDYESILYKLKNTTLSDYEPTKCKYCRQNGLCEYYSKCFVNEENIPDDSILTLVSSQNKNTMYENGIELLKDADLELIEGNRVQFAQIQASKNNGLFYDEGALRSIINRLDVRPISFVDFEWDRYLVPPYINMKPLDVLCFEYALYYIDENGKMEHRTFVGTGDCRRQFIESLINNVPNSGPILAYNADGAEKLRLIELSNMFPEYKDKLEEINNRFFDLAIPFIDGIVYDTRMAGNYTLKKLVDICSEYSYDDLDIYDGMEAVYNWRNIDKGIDGNPDKVVDDLKKYCSLDAYGLYLVYKWLKSLLIKSKE